jgi:hypothetical protein
MTTHHPSQQSVEPGTPTRSSPQLAEHLPVLPNRTLRIEPWLDPVVDRIGYPLSSDYVEQFWLGVLGPTSTWLLRRFDAVLRHHAEGFDVDLATLAGSLGLHFDPGQAGPFGRSIHRCVIFGLAQPVGSRLAVRRHAPPLSLRQVARLPAALRNSHEHWMRVNGRRAS